MEISAKAVPHRTELPKKESPQRSIEFKCFITTYFYNLF